MEITSFNPLIVTKDAAPIVELFEELGFVRRHELAASTGTSDIENIRRKNDGGFYVDVSQVETVPQDLTLIRMNVRDFDEAYDLLIGRGFKNVYGDDAVNTKSSKSAFLIAPSGFGINLIEHLRK